MSALILHHYAMSPFSEKIRAMLGYAQLDWQSVITREMPPRPLLSPLAGGYRKIPVAQIGADIFCDSRTIAAEIARLSGRPELALEQCPARQRAYVGEVDLQVFFACVMLAGTPTMRRKFRQSLSLPDMARFIWDRLNMGRTAAFKPLSGRAARSRVEAHLDSVDNLLEQDFLFGPQPTHADFSTYHSLWFLRDLAESPLLEQHPQTLAWMDRIKAFGHGRRHEISAEQALEMARQASPRSIPSAQRRDQRIGQPMQVTPVDYRQTPTTGTLVGVTANSWILARQQAEVGTVHVHFPQQGFALDPA
ncbi:glutathione S-transferase family protein [Pseudomonas sp. N040]|uniref:glutathione S-transferase family protein n=1 Tax=Pseudomonas sp. N040 TaxID=2785325 RepID=UPI0018A299CA|nr:glutathione S-transferase family protein [Pseudomonas sp. N040]MBF7731544.1 glutathione S-transferase family protein [Pseudomonas sp. N040]MBW7015188.1 glutathione S-transferase family protein [Pseudomonas sp. N040]